MNHNHGSDWPAFIVETGVVFGMFVFLYMLFVFLPGK